MRVVLRALVVALLLLLSASPTALAQDGGDDTPEETPTIARLLADLAEDDDAPQFTQLLNAVRGADAAVLETLADPNAELTVFAPTDNAFELLALELGRRPTNEILNSQTVLAGILLYHTLPYTLSSDELIRQLDDRNGFVTLPTAQGQALDVLQTDAGISIDGVAELVIEQLDIPASNGVVHVIDAVLLPEAGTVAEVLQMNYAEAEQPEFTALLDAVGSADASVLAYLGALDNEFVLLAPTDAAFAGLGTVEDLDALLARHVLPGRLNAATIAEAVRQGPLEVETLNGDSVTFDMDDGGTLVVDGATIIAVDIDAVNGVIFVLDAVLAPATTSDSAE